MNKIKSQIAVSIMAITLLVSACSDGGSSQGNSEPQEKSGYNPADFELTQSSDLPVFGSTQVAVKLKNLPTDDPVYLAVTSSEQENGQLTVKPHRALINPNEGEANVLLTLTDTGITAQPNITVTVTTSGNTVMEQNAAIQRVK